MSFKRFPTWRFGGPLVLWSGTICANLVAGIKWNNPGNIFKFGPGVQEEMSFKKSLQMHRSRMK